MDRVLESRQPMRGESASFGRIASTSDSSSASSSHASSDTSSASSACSSLAVASSSASPRDSNSPVGSASDGSSSVVPAPLFCEPMNQAGKPKAAAVVKLKAPSVAGAASAAGATGSDGDGEGSKAGTRGRLDGQRLATCGPSCDATGIRHGVDRGDGLCHRHRMGRPLRVRAWIGRPRVADIRRQYIGPTPGRDRRIGRMDLGVLHSSKAWRAASSAAAARRPPAPRGSARRAPIASPDRASA